MQRKSLSVVVLVTILTAGAAAADRKPFGDHAHKPQYARDRQIDVEHYRLNVTFDPQQKTVGGIASVSLSAINDGLTEVELDAGPMDIQSVRLFAVEGKAELPFEHDGRKLRVKLPRAYRAGESLTIDIDYAATAPRAGLYFTGPDAGYPDKPRQVWSQGEAEDNHLWFPSFDYPNDRATSEEVYTVPAGWTAIGNGKLLESRTNDDGSQTFHYKLDVPHVTYLVSVVAGEFEKYTDDFDGTPVEYFVPKGTGRETALRSFGPTPDMLRFFSEQTGVRYPYPKYSQACAVDFIYGGMENISATTQTAETLHDAIAAEETDSWGLVAHEAAHQWYGDLLTCADWSQAWLNEGFATYWENLWREHAQGRDVFLYEVLQDRDAYLNEDRNEYRRPIVQENYSAPMDLFDSHLYPKGAWVLHMMRGVLGDALFFKAIQHYTQTHREQVVETADLRQAIFQATGVNLKRFFDQWLYHGGHPELSVTRDWDAEAGVLTLHFEQTQEVDALTPLFSMPIDVAVDTDGGTVRRTLQLSRRAQDLMVALPSEPRLVRIDPDFFVLMELNHQRPPAEILRALVDDPNPVGRIFAARDAAKKVPTREAVAGLSAALTGDAFWPVRLEAAQALGAIRGGAAREALERGLGDKEARVRTASAKALGEFRDDPAVAAALARVLDGDRAYGPRAAAVLSLARVRAPGAGAAIERALKLDSHREQIRAAALEALGELGDGDALPLLSAWSAYGKPPRARTAAISAIGKLVTEGKSKKEAEAVLLDLLDDPYIWARGEAIQALASLRVAAAVDPIARAAEVEQDSRLRATARKALARLREPATPGHTVEELAAELERLREESRAQTRRIEELEKQR